MKGILFLLIYVCIFYESIQGGSSQPIVLIALFIMVLMAGILIDSKAGLICAIILSIHLLIFNYAENYKIINIDHSWKSDAFNQIDVVEYSILLIFASLFYWLSNNHLEKSLKRSREAEKNLQNERDGLEIVIKKRTDEIKNLQIEKINSMYRMVEFGRISSILFHDIMNPLTNIVLNLKTFKIDDAQETVGHLVPSIRRIEDLIHQSKTHMKIDETCTLFDVKKETISVINLLKSKSNKDEVRIVVSKKMNNEIIYGPQILFSHVIMNLISNGIDSHNQNIKDVSLVQRKTKVVIIDSRIKSKSLFIRIIDNGCGIEENIIKNIFEPFYTTKKEQGCGIGLSATKYILEKYFNGTISVKSKIQKGTTFTVVIPINAMNK